MEPETRYPLIGAVVLGLALAAAFAFAWWARDGAAGARLFTVVFEHQSVDGLQVGSDVSMRGVKVGRVERFTLDADAVNRVKVLVRLDPQAAVSVDTSAVVTRNFVTGLARIILETPVQPGERLVQAPAGEPYPVIPEGRSGIDQITQSANRLAVTGEEALANLNRLMSEENRAVFGQTLAAARNLAMGLEQRMTTLDATLRGVDASARTFRDSSLRITEVVEQAAGQLGALATEATGAIGETRAAVGESRQTLTEFTRLARTLERQVGELGERTGGLADAGLLELRASAQEARRAAEMLSQALERLSEPRSALIGPGARELGPGERLQ